jgi:hypothetical protein
VREVAGDHEIGSDSMTRKNVHRTSPWLPGLRSTNHCGSRCAPCWEYLSTFLKKMRFIGPFIRSRRHSTLPSNGLRDFLLLEITFEISSRLRDILVFFVCASNYWIVSSAVDNVN